MINAEALLRVRISETKLQDGYDIEVLDRFLDQAVAAILHYEKGGVPAGAPLTSVQVLAARFPATKLRKGYDVAEANGVLGEVVATLQAWERAPR